MFTKSFEPTYEEWKLVWNKRTGNIVGGFEPTYEEWKQVLLVNVRLLRFRFEPTYEEWKQLQGGDGDGQEDVLSLPMRNGNPDVPMFPYFPAVVLSLPMRNGNIKKDVVDVVGKKGFEPTYEEWKLMT